jgi:hypothetical protein
VDLLKRHRQGAATPEPAAGDGMEAFDNAGERLGFGYFSPATILRYECWRSAVNIGLDWQ